MTVLALHCHGKNRVRVLRVFRDGNQHRVFEVTLRVTLLSTAEKSFLSDDNSHVVATDTMKNTAYVAAKENTATSPEAFAISYAQLLLSANSVITGVRVEAEQNLWNRYGQHQHGFVRDAPEVATADVSITRGQQPIIRAGIKGLVVLKTTQSGFSGFFRNQHTSLPEVTERLLSTSITADWVVKPKPVVQGSGDDGYTRDRQVARKALLDTFFGPEQTGVFSASVQRTMYLMGEAALAALPEIDAIHISMPNIHFLPAHFLSNLGTKFDHDVYVPTDEPHGTIESTIARNQTAASKL